MLKGSWLWLALYLVIAGIYGVALRGYGPSAALRGALVMALFVLLAIGAVRSIFRAQEDQRLIRAALAGAAPVDGRRSAVLGTLVTLGPALTSPFSHTLCAAYSYRIFHRVEIETEEGTGTSIRVDFVGSASSPVAVRTRTGLVRLSPHHMSQGFLPKLLDAPSHIANANDYLQVTRFADRSGLKIADAVSDLQVWNHLAEGGGELRTDWRTAQGRFTLDPQQHTLEEGIVPVDVKVCAIGLYHAAQRELLPQPRKVLKLIRGVPISTGPQARSEARQKVGAAIFLLLASHAGLFLWLGIQAADARRAQAAAAQAARVATTQAAPVSTEARAVAPSPVPTLTVQDIPSPRPTGWSVDLTGRIPRETLAQIDRLGDEAKATGSGELAVAVVDTLGNVPSQTFAAQLYRAWGLDERGILLLVALDYQRVEILLGRDLAHQTGGDAARMIIIRGVMMPRLRANDPGGAVLAGASSAARRFLDLSIPATEPASPAAPR
jgi:hypothetical protein